MKKLLTLWVLCALVATSFAQDDTTISADRPGMATGVGVLPFKSVQWETGFQYDYTGEHAIALPSTMLRVGVTPFAELRLQYDGALESADGKQWAYAVQPLTIGTKIRLFDGNEQHKWIPQMAFLAYLSVPCTKELAAAQKLAPSAYLLFSNDVTDWFNIGYNLGVEWDGVQPVPSTFVALCLGFNITDNLGAFVESYNYINGYGKSLEGKVNLDFGFNYLVHPRVQLDVYGAFNCQNPKSYSNVGLGVAWLIK